MVNEINRDSKLKKFIGIDDSVPTAGQIYEYMSRYSPSQYNNIFNSILKKFYNKKRRVRDTYMVDATPVASDINIVKKYVTPERLEELKLKWVIQPLKVIILDLN